MQREPVYILLPPGEHFSEYNGGAVAIVVNSMSQHSDYTPMVIGDTCSQPMTGAQFHPVTPFLYRLRSRSRAYAGACKAWLKRQPAGIVEVHNRIPLLMHLRDRVPQHKYCMYLHNDPQSMKGAKTAEERRQLLSKVACIYAVSEFVKNRFLDGLTEGGDKVHVLHNGIEPAVFKNKRPPLNRLVSALSFPFRKINFSLSVGQLLNKGSIFCSLTELINPCDGIKNKLVAGATSTI